MTPFCPECATLDSTGRGNRKVGAPCRTHHRTKLVDLSDPAVLASLAARDRARRLRRASQGLGVGLVISAVVVAAFVLTDAFHPYLGVVALALGVAGWCFGFSLARPRYRRWTHAAAAVKPVGDTHWTRTLEQRVTASSSGGDGTDESPEGGPRLS